LRTQPDTSAFRSSRDDTPVIELDGAEDAAVELAVDLVREQDAEVLILRHLHDRLAARGSVGAPLRF
jgi:hypothetical protein